MKLFTISLCLLLCAGLAAAAAIDGKWVSERKFERDGQSFVFNQTFELKSEGSKLSGSVSTKFGEREPMVAQIKDGKVEGSKFSFAVTMTTPNGDMTTVYQGEVAGDTLKGTAGREGGQSRPFEAKRK